MDKLAMISEYLKVSHVDFDKYGIYDGYANIDSELYINPK